MVNIHSAAESKESGTKIAHEYIRDILPFSYQECTSCGNRTDLTCIRCGYCYSCHWKAVAAAVVSVGKRNMHKNSNTIMLILYLLGATFAAGLVAIPII